MKTRSHFRAAFLVLLTLAACSKSKLQPDPVPKPDPNPVITIPKNASMCEAFYIILNSAEENYLQKKSTSFDERLKTSIENFENEMEIKLDESIQSHIKNGDCTVPEALIENVNSRKKEEIDVEAFVYQNLVNKFAKTLDRFSSFTATYTISRGNEAELKWGIRVLERSDYYQNYFAPKDDRAPSRNPNYLYIEYSPPYLQSTLPKFTRIKQIDDFVVAEHTFQEALDAISKNETANLKIQLWDAASGTYKDADVDVEFQEYNSRSITFELVHQNPEIGYLQIPTFYKSDLDTDFYKSWIEFLNTRAKNLDGIIFDMRGNTGGYTIESEKFLSTVFKNQDTFSSSVVKNDNKLTAQERKIRNPFPINYGKILVLTDFMTASASEVTAAALKDYNAALVVGESTLGKGIGQGCNDFHADKLSGELCVTSFYLFSPAGHSWYLNGIQPDIEIKESANTNYYRKFSDIQDVIPTPYSDGIETKFNADAELSVDKVTDSTRGKLQSFYAGASGDDKNCTGQDTALKIDVNKEEDSCIRKWGVKLLQEWIRLEPTAVAQ